MDDKKKLVELLCEAHSKATDAGAIGDASYGQQLNLEADHLIANGVTVHKWISVTEELPERMQPVILCREGNKVEQGYRDVGDWWKVYGTRTKRVTHWMPLPEPPKGE